MSNDYTLVVVDMQNAFTASRSTSVRKNCQREILQAKKNKNPIILVEYSTHGRTVPSLSKLTKNYNKTWTALKNAPDGSREVSNIILHHKLHRDVRVCGVNTNACVHYTVKGLGNAYYINNIYVVKDACNSCTFNGNEIGFGFMKKIFGVKIV